MQPIPIDIQPGYRIVSQDIVQGKLNNEQVDLSSVYIYTGLSEDNPPQYNYEYYPDPNGDAIVGKLTYDDLMTNYKVLTQQEWVGLKSGKVPDNWMETLEAYASAETDPAVKTAGFMGLPKLFWYVAGGLAIYYIAKRNKMI